MRKAWWAVFLEVTSQSLIGMSPGRYLVTHFPKSTVVPSTDKRYNTCIIQKSEEETKNRPLS